MVLLDPLDQALKTYDVYCKASPMGRCLLLMPQPKTVPAAPIRLGGKPHRDHLFEVAGQDATFANLDRQAAIERALYLVETCGAWNEQSEGRTDR